MAANAFEWACEELERESSMGRLEARGTVRLCLKEAGLNPRFASAAELAVVVEKLLPQALEARGVGSAARLCSQLTKGLGALVSTADSGRPESPEAVFRRLAEDLGGD